MKLNNSMATAISVPRPFRSFFLVSALIICLIHGFGTVTAQKVLNLTATGQNIKWYLTPTGGTPIDPSTDLVNNQKYYASQTVNGVESTERLEVTAYIVTCWTCGTESLNVSHTTTGGVAPVNKSTTYGTVNNIPGEPSKCWITSNLGSDQLASSVSDATEASSGWYWQFNRKQGYMHNGSYITPAWTISAISENSEWLTANDPCNLELGAPWRIPTLTEWNNVDNTGSWTDWYGPWNSGLKLHAAGYLYYVNGTVYNRGSYGFYWSSSQDGDSSAWDLLLYSGGSNTFNNGKSSGFTVRCLRDN